MNILVKDFMQQPVFAASLPNDVGTIRDLMNQKSCHAIPLVEVDTDKDINILGIVTSDDLVGVYDDTTNIQQVMTEKVIVTHPNSSASLAAKMMIRHNTHHLVVMEQEEIVGIVSSLDFVKLIADNDAQAE